MRVTESKGSRFCETPAPTPFAPFQLYGDDQRCLEARPIASVSSLDECFRECYGNGLEPSYFFAVADDVCYGCQTWWEAGTYSVSTLFFPI